MRVASLIIPLLMIAACTDTQKPKPVVDKAGRKFVYLFGFIYGPVEKIVQTSKNSFNNDRETSVLTFYDNGKKVAWENNGKIFAEMYFDDQFRIDSMINFNSTKSTSFFYKYPYYEDYVHYSVSNGNAHDTIKQTMDSATQSASFFINGAVSSTDYFDKEGLLVKKALSEGHERFEYDEFGNVTEKYISVLKAGINNFKHQEISYEYDSYGNWTKKTLKKMNPTSPGFTMTTSRVITYKK
jgi:YD repeat-containing protein